MTLTSSSLDDWGRRLTRASEDIAREFPGESPDRQPVHTVYGGAHLFSAGTAARLGELALDFADRWVGDPKALAEIVGIDGELAERVHQA
ncbi:MAG: phosphoenolpyruvate kinase, partial [Actinobacteria bacterium]|nr:phosphoenolpyruvate kinase [Actinomycetota bacterium]